MKQKNLIRQINNAHAGELEKIMINYFKRIGKEEWCDLPYQEIHEYYGNKPAGAAFERWVQLVDNGEYNI